MTEQELNNILLVSRKAADYQHALGNIQNYKDVLKYSSEWAQKMIVLYGFNEPVQCNQCSKIRKDVADRDYIRKFGFCLSCDSLHSEALLETIKELKDGE